MSDFAWRQSETRMRAFAGRAQDVAYSVHEVELAVRERGSSSDSGIVMSLRLIERACFELERWSNLLGAQHVCDAWLDACAQWVSGVGATIVSAFSYDDGPERKIALALAAEESSMRFLMGLERGASETVAVLRNLDGNAARAARELAAKIELADRILHARMAA